MKTGKIKSQRIQKEGGTRLDGRFYLNNDSMLSMVVEDLGKVRILSQIAECFNPPVFKRQFCNKTQRAIPYFQSSDVSLANEFSDSYVFGEQAKSLNLLVRKGDILITGFGTIGNVRLVSKHQDGVCYANNVCRVRNNGILPSGYIYAFLSSRYGSAQLNKNGSGSVVRYIESPGIEKTLIPDFPYDFQQKIDEMIKESARLREEAADALAKVHKIFVNEISVKLKPVSKSVSIQQIIQGKGNRFEGELHVSKAKAFLDAIVETFPYHRVGDLTTSLFTENIFKREYVDNGVPFMMGSEILKSIPKASKYISHRQASKKDELFVKEGWILMTCSGSVGDVVYVDKQLTQFIYTHDLIRIIPKDEETQLYLFGFLSSPIGKELVNLFKYGSVIQHLEAFHVADIPVPILDEHKKIIAERVKEYVVKNSEAKKLEQDAISIVEAEIEMWAKE